ERMEFVPNLDEFTNIYVDSFIASFERIQSNYRNQRTAFDNLFALTEEKDSAFLRAVKRKLHISDYKKEMWYRWEKTLERLDRTNAAEIGNELMEAIKN
ncbi:MAG: hypothetical protein V3V78_03945, partial [Candidatus Woesearchaeota archaeon]